MARMKFAEAITYHDEIQEAIEAEMDHVGFVLDEDEDGYAFVDVGEVINGLAESTIFKIFITPDGVITLQEV